MADIKKASQPKRMFNRV